MKNTKKKRNWSEYNQKLVNQASLTLYISDEMLQNGGRYTGPHHHGGIKLYSDTLIEACLLIKIYYKLGFRQTQGFVRSLFQLRNMSCKIPDYSTLCKRMKKLKVDLQAKINLNKPLIIAIDATGLSLLTSQSWNRHKHNRKSNKPTGKLWHKLHIAIDTQTGQILSCQDTPSSITDGKVLPELMDKLPTKNIQAVCADKAYDTFDCRKKIKEAGAYQCIPPTRTAVHTDTLVHKLSSAKWKERQYVFAERNAAIAYFKANMINGSDELARKNWKKLVGYHKRSLVETTMWQLKAHTTDQLKSKNPLNMASECRIKCKIVNIVNAVS